MVGKPEGSIVYFISSDDVPDFPIKIGRSTDSAENRLRSLQTGCPYRLVVLAVIEVNPRYEWILHCQLREHRLEGEWFKRHPDVLAELKKAQKRQQRAEADRERDLKILAELNAKHSPPHPDRPPGWVYDPVDFARQLGKPDDAFLPKKH